MVKPDPLEMRSLGDQERVIIIEDFQAADAELAVKLGLEGKGLLGYIVTDDVPVEVVGKLESDSGPAELVVKLLRERGETISLAESCTGGLAAKLISDIPGSSAVFTESIVTYSNDAKIRRLGVKRETLDAVGAVSGDCVFEMANGLRASSGSTYALSISGIAGPDGGSEEKPVGTVFVGLANPAGVDVRSFTFSGNRHIVRVKAAYTALNMVLNYLKKEVENVD